MSKIEAKILSVKEGVRAVEDVFMIRIRSKKYNLLIMQDYMATLGEVDGEVDIVTEQEEISLKHIRGFYIHSHNKFELLVSEVRHD